MCGIAGIVHADQSHPVSPHAIKEMCEMLVHRGPDDFGSYVEGQVGIGMRRLSIIDLHTGEQPIANEDRSIKVVFNGEIYNYRQLRKELEAKGHRLRTTSDTEVIVHLYEELGEHLVHRLRGMFAFAMWDARPRMLMLARDRLGIKRLYYAEVPEGLVFGSELKAVLMHPQVSREVNLHALAEYFMLLCIPGDLSIYTAVKKLPAAHILTYREGRVRLSRYWHIQPTPDDQLTETDWVGLLQHHLRDAVESHLVARNCTFTPPSAPKAFGNPASAMSQPRVS